MLRLNKHCLALLGATWFAAGASYGVVDTARAQVLFAKKIYPGKILSLGKIQSPKTGMPGMKMTLKISESKKLIVHMGAEWIGLSRRLQLTEGDNIVVTGPLVSAGDKAVLLAREIKKGSKKIVLMPKFAE